MPELPEVETVVRELRGVLSGDVISSVEIFRSNPIVQGDSDLFQEQLRGRKFLDVTRRAKYLIFHLQPERYLLAHLRMTGKFIVCDPLQRPSKHNRVLFHLKSRRVMIFDDIRCFGTLEVYDNLADSKALLKLGIEPLSSDLTSDFFMYIFNLRYFSTWSLIFFYRRDYKSIYIFNNNSSSLFISTFKY